MSYSIPLAEFLTIHLLNVFYVRKLKAIEARFMDLYRMVPNSLLDIGAGYFPLTRAALASGYHKVIAIEPLRSPDRDLQENNHLEYFNLSLSDLSKNPELVCHSPSAFPVLVACVSVLDEVMDKEQFLSQLLAISPPGSFFYIEVRNTFYPLYQYSSSSRPCDVDHHHYLEAFSSAGLSVLFRSTTCRPISFRSTALFLKSLCALMLYLFFPSRGYMHQYYLAPSASV